MKKKYIKLCICVFSLLAALFFIWTSFLWKIFSSGIAGSYTHAETWTFKIKENDLINIINEIKKEYPQLEPPNVSYPTSGRNGYWYEFLFYYNDTNQEVQTWVRANTDTLYTTFAFVAVMPHFDTLTPITNIKMDAREINHDFGYWENKREINKFEKMIIAKIEKKILENSK